MIFIKKLFITTFLLFNYLLQPSYTVENPQKKEKSILNIVFVFPPIEVFCIISKYFEQNLFYNSLFCNFSRDKSSNKTCLFFITNFISMFFICSFF